MRRIVPLVAGLAGALVLAAPAQALTCSTSSAGPLPNVIVTVGLASGETATVTTSVGPGPTVLLDIAGCALEEAEAVRRLDVTGAGGAETLVYAPAAATPLPASAFTEPWRVDLGAGTGDAIELRTAGSATTLTVGADGLALDADGDRELDAPLGVEQVRLLGSVEGDVLSGAGGAGTGAPTSLPLRLVGGDGSDLLRPGLGADEVFGGDDLDFVSYAGRAGGVSADPDGLADDGAPGEGDRVGTDVEGAIGGEGPDVLESSPGASSSVFAPVTVLVGNGGTDVLRLATPAETLFTQIRADGGAGRDELRGGAGSDILPASM